MERVSAFGNLDVIQCGRTSADHLGMQDTEKLAVRGQAKQET